MSCDATMLVLGQASTRDALLHIPAELSRLGTTAAAPV